MHSSIRSRLIALVRAQWAGVLALFLVIAGGTAYAADTIGSDDIINGQVKSVDIGNNQVQSADIKDGSLNDEDIGQGTFHFTGDIGNVAAGDCVERVVTGVNAQDDHLLLTPSFATLNSRLIYSAEYDHIGDDMVIQACNFTGSLINDGTTDFNLLVIDEQ
jgi:hypothetical protein